MRKDGVIKQGRATLKSRTWSLANDTVCVGPPLPGISISGSKNRHGMSEENPIPHCASGACPGNNCIDFSTRM